LSWPARGRPENLSRPSGLPEPTDRTGLRLARHRRPRLRQPLPRRLPLRAPPDADLDLLRWFDDLAYAEALRCGGLLRYFKGDADARGHCLSFCLWESREAALRAAGGKKHEQAASITARMYVSYDLERYELTPGKEGRPPVFRKI
jgi:hypothetical protein